MTYSSFSRRHKRDSTHAEVAQTIAAFGFSVIDISASGGGLGDLLVGLWDVTDMIEVKRDDKATYTQAQLELRKSWRGAPIVRLENKAQAEEWARRTRNERGRASAIRAVMAKATL